MVWFNFRSLIVYFHTVDSMKRVIGCQMYISGYRMACECALVLLGWVFLLYLLYHLATILYNLIYPFFIATPINLRKAAGGKWAGKKYLFPLIFLMA